MRHIILVLRAEIEKQQQHNYHSYFVYFSMLVWPVLGFLEVYYTYKPFSFAGSSEFSNPKDLLAFLAAGYMAYTCFWSMVQNAWSMSYQERTGGTLETAFLSPANRMAMNYGKALGALLQEVWMFCCFCIFILFYTGSIRWDNILLLPAIFVLLVAASTVWGGMLNALFLFSRDAGIFMDVLDAPMVLFSGTRIPVNCFPAWARVLSLFFPLTYCLNIIRLALHLSGGDTNIGFDLICLGVCMVLMVSITKMLLLRAEGNNRRSGELQFY